LQTHQCCALEAGQVQWKRPIDEWDLPLQNEIASIRTIWRQQEVAATQEQKKPFQPPDWPKDTDDPRLAGQQNADL
jgi:hypothetical protein